MDITSSSFDIILLVSLSIFAFLSFLKGFIKDFFSTINLILATSASYFFGPIISSIILGSAPNIIIDLGISSAIFIIALIIGSIVNSKILGPLLKIIPTAINQSLGFGFGFAKGYFIAAFAFAAIMSFYSPSSFDDKSSDRIGPKWLIESKSYNLLLFGSDWIRPIINNLISKAKDDIVQPEGAYEIEERDHEDNSDGSKKESAISKALSGVMKMQKLNKEISNYGKKDKGGSKDNKKDKDIDNSGGYSEQERKKMQRLIEIMSN